MTTKTLKIDENIIQGRSRGIAVESYCRKTSPLIQIFLKESND